LKKYPTSITHLQVTGMPSCSWEAIAITADDTLM